MSGIKRIHLLDANDLCHSSIQCILYFFIYRRMHIKYYFQYLKFFWCLWLFKLISKVNLLADILFFRIIRREDERFNRCGWKWHRASNSTMQCQYGRTGEQYICVKRPLFDITYSTSQHTKGNQTKQLFALQFNSRFFQTKYSGKSILFNAIGVWSIYFVIEVHNTAPKLITQSIITLCRYRQ